VLNDSDVHRKQWYHDLQNEAEELIIKVKSLLVNKIEKLLTKYEGLLIMEHTEDVEELQENQEHILQRYLEYVEEILNPMITMTCAKLS